ncbi:odorant receptor 85c-like [Pseudomyrmex gracilis]|uniref:odorant receptor 85c-like n=1 Tax=Pseudomyrmex gracilis TaxID=219809 RepID=UPI00099537FD|nr:odorant receptor 85c-like [Pseudomyrmex gracilis]
MDLRWIVAVLLEVIPMCVYFSEIYLHCNGAKESFDYVTIGAAAALALTRLVVPRVHREKLLELVTSMTNDWATQKDKKIRWIMNKYAAMSTRVTTLTFVLVSVIIAVYVSVAVSAIIAKIHKVDNVSARIQSCVFRSEASRQTFIVIQAMQMLVTGISTFGTTSFFFGLAMHLCAQFDALGVKLSEIRVGKTRNREIAKTVERHCHLIRLAECMERSFNANVLIYLFVTTTLMCINGFQLIVSLQFGNLSMIAHHTNVLLLMMIQLSFYTYAGDRLEMKSAALAYATYECEWYKLPASVAKDFQIILLRASIPHQLTAGRFVPMNMMTFKDILKSTASYLSVLRVMLDE